MRFPLASSYRCYREPTEITKTGFPAFTSGNYASDDGWMTIAEKGYHHHPPPWSSTERQVMVVLDHITLSSYFATSQISVFTFSFQNKDHKLAIPRRPTPERSGFDYPLSTTPPPLDTYREANPYDPSPPIGL
jgi:hypothetical protein